MVEQVEGLDPEFGAPVGRADRERAEQRKVDVPVSGSAELVPPGITQEIAGRLTERRRIEVEPGVSLVTDDLYDPFRLAVCWLPRHVEIGAAGGDRERRAGGSV